MNAEKNGRDDAGARRKTGSRTAGDFLAIGIVAALVAVVMIAATLSGSEKEPGIFALLYFLFLLIYVPLTCVALRTVKLRGALRYFFSLTAAPVYVLLFMASTVWLLDLFPTLAEYLRRSLAAGGRRSGVMQGIISGAASAILFWFWYVLLKRVDRVIHGPDAAAGSDARPTDSRAVLTNGVQGNDASAALAEQKKKMLWRAKVITIIAVLAAWLGWQFYSGMVDKERRVKVTLAESIVSRTN